MPARIDGTVGDIAMEIESRVSKQVRGAVLDLVCHPYPKKLLILLPVHMNPVTTETQCRNILRRFVDPKNFEVVVLHGTGHDQRRDQDVLVVQDALRRLSG